MSRLPDRRKFLGRAALAAGAIGVLPRRLLSAPASLPADLVLVKGEPGPAVRRAISALGGMGRFVKPGQRVVLKPNMSFPTGVEAGATTHPEVVAEVARLVAEAGAKEILVADYPLRRPEVCVSRSGILEACARIPRTQVRFFAEEKFFEEVGVPRGKVLDRVKVLKPLLEADIYLNLPTAKTHGAVGVSLGLKNQMGLIWDRNAFHTRFDLGQAIADLASALKPQLTILDASRALVTGGPGGPGKVVWLHRMVAGVNPVEVDALGVTLTPWYDQVLRPDQVSHLRAARALGLGDLDPEKYRYQQVEG
ncbi:MAG: hypothetical protein A2V67_13565 [Deltaproteobacteria bacterium RBG_13_61_14]|nr:MAG: hypothetical protein A2V67_13565 [Deltaproteobacteria bacterium RBG_13_61_14]